MEHTVPSEDVLPSERLQILLKVWVILPFTTLIPHSLCFRPLPADPSDQLCVHCPWAKWRPAVRLLLPGRPTRQFPGPGHGGHRQVLGLELRLHCGVRGQLWGEGGGCLHAALQRSRWDWSSVHEYVWSANGWLSGAGRMESLFHKKKIHKEILLSIFNDVQVVFLLTPVL